MYNSPNTLWDSNCAISLLIALFGIVASLSISAGRQIAFAQAKNWLTQEEQDVSREVGHAEPAKLRVARVQECLRQQFVSRDYPNFFLDLVPNVITGLHEVSLGIAD